MADVKSFTFIYCNNENHKKCKRRGECWKSFPVARAIRKIFHFYLVIKIELNFEKLGNLIVHSFGIDRNI